MVQLFEQAPCPALRPFIQRFLVVKFPFFHRDAHLADTRPVAAFSFRGRCPIDGDQWATPAAFTGLRQTLRVHEHCHEHAVLLATFTAGGRNGFSASVARCGLLRLGAFHQRFPLCHRHSARRVLPPNSSGLERRFSDCTRRLPLTFAPGSWASGRYPTAGRHS